MSCKVSSDFKFFSLSYGWIYFFLKFRIFAAKFSFWLFTAIFHISDFFYHLRNGSNFLFHFSTSEFCLTPDFYNIFYIRTIRDNLYFLPEYMSPCIFCTLQWWNWDMVTASTKNLLFECFSSIETVEASMAFGEASFTAHKVGLWQLTTPKIWPSNVVSETANASKIKLFEGFGFKKFHKNGDF